MHLSGWTLLLQAVNFVALAYLLRRFLFRPVLGVLARRREAADAARAQAAQAAAAVAAEREALARERTRLDESRARQAADGEAALAHDRDRIVAEARATAAAMVAEARRRIADERAGAERSLHMTATELAAALAARLLAGAGQVIGAAPFVARVTAELASLPAREREAARTVVLAVAPSIPDGHLEDWRAQIARLCGGARVDAVVDPSLIAGAELRSPHFTLHDSLRDGLARAAAALVDHADAR